MGIVAGSFLSSVYAAPQCYEGFDYAGASLNGKSGGSGWDGAWSDPEGGLTLSGDGTSLEFSASLKPGIGARVSDSNGGGATRKILNPVDLNQEGTVTYISMRVNKGSIAASSSEYIELNLAHGTSIRFEMGIGSNDKFYVEVGVPATKPESVEAASANTTYLLVAKIVSGVATDTAYLKAYESGSTPDASEPATWTVSDTGNTGFALDTLRLSMGTAINASAIDEIRIGTTWESVVPLGKTGLPIR